METALLPLGPGRPCCRAHVSPRAASRVVVAQLSSGSSSDSGSALCERLQLNDQFDRWKFLQELLDDSVDRDDIHQVLYAVLERYYTNHCRKPAQDDSDELSTNSRRRATPEQRDILQSLLETAADEFCNNDDKRNIIPAIADEATLAQVEQLIPDPQEEEDAFKSLWDTVCELHGREAVKVNEQEAATTWKALSIVARVLIHYDLLSEGIAAIE